MLNSMFLPRIGIYVGASALPHANAIGHSGTKKGESYI